MLTSFTIGLSHLSNDMSNGIQLSAEARRVLSLLDGRPIVDGDIKREENGRPYFDGREEDCSDFNISHSGSVSAVSLVKGENLRTGCDVQIVRPRVNSGKIAAMFFPAAEREYIRDDEKRFFQIWVLKECFLKLRGFSVFDMAAAPSFVCEAESGAFALREVSPLPIAFYLYELSGPRQPYLLAAAIKGAEQLRPSIQWFSQSLLPCKSIAEIKAAPSPAETVSPKM